MLARKSFDYNSCNLARKSIVYNDGVRVVKDSLEMKVSGDICIGGLKMKSRNLYNFDKKIAVTLQGYIYKGRKADDICGTFGDVVIKTANKTLYKQGITIQHGHRIKINEDIVKECTIMKYLTLKYYKNNNKPKGFTKLIDCYNDKKNIYSVQEFGGKNFFDYVSKKHKLIKTNKLSLNAWRDDVKTYFGQIINTINWMHNYVNVCHLDMSLENMCIDIKSNYVNIIDFGLSERFKKKRFMCKKWVGKHSYNSPEIANKQVFDARSGDIWAVGVCLFKMWFGITPYNYAVLSDPYFNNIWNGFLLRMLNDYNMGHYWDEQICGMMCICIYFCYFYTKLCQFRVNNNINYIYILYIFYIYIFRFNP